MDRRRFLASATFAGAASLLPSAASSTVTAPASNLLILIELRGGNDGLNTVVPHADSSYYRLRPTLAIPRSSVVALDRETGLHPALRPLARLWDDGDLALIRGLGEPGGAPSHLRAIDAWDTAGVASGGGWLARAFHDDAARVRLAHDGTAGCNEGPMAGANVSSLAHECVSPARFSDAAMAAGALAASDGQLRAIKLSLGGFDTHAKQAHVHAALLGELAEGVVGLRAVLAANGRWARTLVMTYSEFGRSASENAKGGTDHGAASAHLLAGGAVRGGIHGIAPTLSDTGAAADPVQMVDFRRAYAAILERWWGVDSERVLGRRYTPLDVIRS